MSLQQQQQQQQQQEQQCPDLSGLLTAGVAVYSLNGINFNAENFTSQQLEFLDTTKELRMGARGTLGTPSSQHCEEIRKVRLQIHNALATGLAKVFPGKYLEFAIDRYGERYQGTTIQGDDWHRDVSGQPVEGTEIYGGWFNLNTYPLTEKERKESTQYFSHVPNTWTDELPSGGKGYDRLNPEDTERYKSLRQIAEIATGCGVMFNEKTVHDVKSEKRPKNSLTSRRVYIKVKISTEPISMFGEEVVLTRLAAQAVMPLNLTDEPPMYDMRHVQYWGDRLEDFSKNVRPELLDAPNEKGKVFVKRFLTSLGDIGRHPEYREEEIRHLLPSLLVFNPDVRAYGAPIQRPVGKFKTGSVGHVLQFAADFEAKKRAKCEGCEEKMPNQMAHMDRNGCLEYIDK
jgi:hypothetical protein